MRPPPRLPTIALMRREHLIAGIAALAVAGLPAAASGQSGPAPPVDAAAPAAARALPEPKPADVVIDVKGVSGGKANVGRHVLGVGTVRPFVAHQTVAIQVTRGKRVVDERTARILQVGAKNRGKFKITSPALIKSGPYRVRAQKEANDDQVGFAARSKRFGIRYPNLNVGQSSRQVEIFNDLLAAKAYYTDRGRHYGSATQRAVLAFRKVNGMARITDANPDIFKTLANGKGGFRLKWPEGGKHIEADLSRQVMVLARNGKAQHIFHISSGAPATPTIRGKFATYRKDYGTNSLGMIHSVYFIRGYATHGYHSVPTYPASHGCLRNPPPNAKFIYNWINIGDVFYTYP